MKIVHINKSDIRGGAAIAASRIVEALISSGIDAKLLVAENIGTKDYVQSVIKNRFDNIKLFVNFLYDLAYFIPIEKEKKNRFAFSLSKKGFNLSTNKAIAEADIIHLHWFNQGFLSLKGLEKILSLGKPVVWTLHDMWAFTGGCHYSAGCTNYEKKCGQCPMLLEPRDNDISNIQHLQKEKIYKNSNLTFVTCSNWLQGLAENATLASSHTVKTIHNPIDTSIYKPFDRIEARKKLGLPLDKKIILFGAANIADPRKGIKLLVYALKDLSDKDYNDEIELVLFGKMNAELESELPFPAITMNYIHKTEKLVNLYNAADLFVLPSLQDNLPNTVVESMACGTPVVAFRVGGVPEMVPHGTGGYLASLGDAQGLSKGIDYVLTNVDTIDFRKNAREKVLEKFEPKQIAQEYIELYKTLLK